MPASTSAADNHRPTPPPFGTIVAADTLGQKTTRELCKHRNNCDVRFLKQIRYFVAAAETGRISQAAMDLNVSQSAVTAAIQQLEATVCARLLERTPNGVTVTMEGSRFLSQGRQILAALAEAVRSTHMSAGPLFGTLRIGVTYTVSGYFLPRHQMRFQASFPGITIELFEAPRDVSNVRSSTARSISRSCWSPTCATMPCS